MKNSRFSGFSLPVERTGRVNLFLEICLTVYAATLFLPFGEIRSACMWGGFLVWLLFADKHYLGKLLRDRGFLLLLGLVGYALLSSLWSPSPKVSLKEWRSTFNDYLAIIPVLVHFAYQADFRQRLIRIFATAGLITVLADCAQYTYEFASGAYKQIDMRMTHYRRPLPLVLFAPFLLVRARAGESGEKWFWYAVFVVAGLLLLPTGARGAWLAFGVGTVLYFAFFLSLRQLLLIPVAGAAIVASIYLVLPADSVVVTKINQGFDTSSRAEGTWRPAIDMSLVHPLRGSGFGKEIYFDQFRKSVATHPHWLIFQDRPPSPHNFYLALWFALGAVGLLLFLALFIHSLRIFVAAYALNGPDRDIFVAFIASITAHYLVRGMLETLTWGPLALLAGTAVAASLWLREPLERPR